MAVLVKTPERVQKIYEDIAKHYQDAVAPNGFKGMVVTFDQECCLLYKAALDELLAPESTEIVISATGSDERFKPYARSRDEEEKLLDRFPRSQRSAEASHRHGEAAHRLRRADPPGPGQAATRPHAAPSDLSHESHVRRQEDPRPHRRLPRSVRRCCQVTGVRREGLPQRRQQHRGAQGPATRGNAEVPRVFPRRTAQKPATRASWPHRSGCRTTTCATPSPPSTRCSGNFRGHFARSDAAAVREGLPLAHAGVRIGTRSAPRPSS